MPQARRIVPDASVVIEAFFPTLDFKTSVNLGKRAKHLIQLIRSNAVVAFAPDQLLAEVLKVSFTLCGRRASAAYLGRDADYAEQVICDVLALPIIYIPASDLGAIALDLVRRQNIPAPDSWYVAAAIFKGAELWVSHMHRDGAIQSAKSVGVSVCTLTEHSP